MVVTLRHERRTGGGEVQLHPFLTSYLNRREVASIEVDIWNISRSTNGITQTDLQLIANKSHILYMSGNVGMRNMDGCAVTWKLKDRMKCNWTAHCRSELDFSGTSQASVVLILFTAIKFHSWKQSLVNCMMASIIILLGRLLKSVESPQIPLYLCTYVCVSLCLSLCKR